MRPQSLTLRLLAAFVLPTLVLFSAAGVAGYELSRRSLEEELGRSLSALAAAAASQLSGPRLLTLEPGDEVVGTRTYRNTLRLLEELRAAAGVRRVFAVDLEGRVRADTLEALPIGAEMPELLRDRLELTRVFGGERAASQVLFVGSDGRPYKTGYAPIRDQGRVVGAVGVEGSAAFFAPLSQLARAHVLAGLLALLVIAAMAVLAARWISQPLGRLVKAALRIGQGDLTTPVAPEPTREIGTLARELESMRDGLEARDRQLKMMLAGVAHEVRNPLGGMELFAGLLEEELATSGAGEEAKSHVRRIRSELEYLDRIVGDFLAFAREARISREELGAIAVLEAARDLMAGEAASRGVELVMLAEPAGLEGDPRLLASALTNLLKNALQASPRGDAVTLRGTIAEGLYRIEVTDHGPGIPSEAQARIFEPFFTTREKGTGLGLPLAKKIIEAHQGALSVESRPGETRFRVELRLRSGGSGAGS